MKNALAQRECKKWEIYEKKIFHEIKLFGSFTGKILSRKWSEKHLENLESI